MHKTALLSMILQGLHLSSHQKEHSPLTRLQAQRSYRNQSLIAEPLMFLLDSRLLWSQKLSQKKLTTHKQ
jgi:hypothetical protein